MEGRLCATKPSLQVAVLSGPTGVPRNRRRFNRQPGSLLPQKVSLTAQGEEKLEAGQDRSHLVKGLPAFFWRDYRSRDLPLTIPARGP